VRHDQSKENYTIIGIGSPKNKEFEQHLILMVCIYNMLALSFKNVGEVAF